MLIVRLVFLGLLLNFAASKAQTVETAVVNIRIVDGIYVDGNGDVYTTPGGLLGGTALGVFTTDGRFEPNYIPGFNGAINIVRRGNSLVATNYDNGTVKSFDLETGDIRTLASGLIGPAGLVVAPSGALYFSIFGGVPGPVGREVYRYRDGESELLLTSNELNRPQGIALDHMGYLYVANSPGGNIFRIDTESRTMEKLVEPGINIGNMVFRNKDRLLYATATQSHRIYTIDLEGQVTLFAGSAMGFADGPLENASFTRPLGLGFTASEDTLYIAESIGRLRRIIMAPVSSVAAKSERDDIEIYPNPSRGRLNIDLPPALEGRQFKLKLLSIDGRCLVERDHDSTAEPIVFNNLADGHYVLMLQLDGRSIIRQLLIRK